MLQAGAWMPAQLPTDVIATSTVMLGGDPTATKTITFKSHGSNQFRWEYSDAPDQASISDLGKGLASGPKGMGLFAQASQPWQFPFLGPLQQFVDPAVVVEYLGTEYLNGTTYKIRLHRIPSPNQPRADEIVAGSPMTIWISAATYLPIQIEYLKQSTTDRLAFEHRLRKYSDYRTFNGVQVAFHQEEWSYGVLLYTFDLTDLKFNAGTSPTQFQLSSAIGGVQ
jgi:hypothetical protein